MFEDFFSRIENATPEQLQILANAVDKARGLVIKDGAGRTPRSVELQTDPSTALPIDKKIQRNMLTQDKRGLNDRNEKFSRKEMLEKRRTELEAEQLEVNKELSLLSKGQSSKSKRDVKVYEHEFESDFEYDEQPLEDVDTVYIG